MQLSTETILFDGRAETVAVADRNYGDPRLSIQKPDVAQVMENGGDMPSILASDCLAEVHATLVDAARAVNLQRGTMKGDVIWTSSGPKIIEIAARLSTAEFCGGLVRYHSGIDYVQEAIRIALGEEPIWDNLKPKFHRYTSARALVARPGTIQAIEGVEEALELPGVAGIDLFVKVGDLVKPLTTHADRIGRFFVVGESRAECREAIERVYETVKIVTR